MLQRTMIALALVLAHAGAARAQVTSPGKLARAHARLDARCAACHDKGTRGKVTAKRCLTCHKALGARVRMRKGYHAAKTDCAACHKDHFGRDHQLIKWPGGKREVFNHLATGYPLRRKHAAVAQKCDKCHRPDRQREPAVRRYGAARRRRTMLGLWPSCFSCHKDKHDGRLGSRCESCHDAGGFKPVKHFDAHARTRFPLRGTHLKTPCSKCHQKDPKNPKSAWLFKGRPHDSCARCHRSPHRDTMGQGAAAQGAARPRACDDCHTESGFRKVAFARATHPQTLPLRGRHARARCIKCHGRKAKRSKLPTTCVGCHKDTHKNRFGQGCVKCHNAGSWRVSSKRLARSPAARVSQVVRREALQVGIPVQKVRAAAFHTKTRFALSGRHVLVPCKKCHRRGRAKRMPKRRFAACASCHRDEHRGQFARHRSLAPKDRRCESCHDTAGWKLTTFDFRRHDGGRFPLEGAHRAVACERCHKRSRSAGKRFTFRILECDRCHRDPHRGKFRHVTDDRPLPCATCHSSRSFADRIFKHDKTKLPLRGKHAKTACTSCHRPDQRGVTTFGPWSGSACETCHADSRHQGQFVSGGRPRGCKDCHDQRQFKMARFDHARQAGLALGGKHTKLKCDRCHEQVTLADGKRVRLFRRGDKRCGSCHASPHQNLEHRMARRRARVGARVAGHTSHVSESTMGECERCHSDRSWRRLKRVADFDHRLVGYALEGRHGQAACGSCHRPGRKVDRRCSSCHLDKHQGQLGRRCAECHTPLDWKPSAMLARHRKTRLPLVGRHALADCTSCHPRARQAVFRGVPSTCFGCHAQQYAAPTTHPDHVRQGFSRRCQQCHRAISWAPAYFGGGSSAGSLLAIHRSFPLSGRHRQLDCKACHQQQQRPSRSCAGCHRQALARARQPDHRAAGIGGRCQQCHDTSRWRPAAMPKHERYFRISSGKHRAVTCNECHTDGTSFRRFSCLSACHGATAMQRRHRGRRGFRPEDRACIRCHGKGAR